MPFEPENISGVVEVWVADDLALSDGAAVSSWAGRVAASSLAQATGGKQPLYRTTGAAGQPAVDFDGSDDLLRFAGVLTSGGSGHIFAVIVVDALTGGAVWSSADEGGATQYFLGDITAAGKIEVAQRNADTADSVNGATTLVVGTPYLCEWISDGVVYELRVNGVVQSLTVTGGSNLGDWFLDTSGRDNFCVGGLKRNSEAVGDYKIAAIGVGSPISAGDRASLYGWANAKYGFSLPIAGLAGTIHEQLHPVQSSAPTYTGTIHQQLHVVTATMQPLAGTTHRQLHIVAATTPVYASATHRRLHPVTARSPAYAGTFRRRLKIVAAETAAALATTGLSVTVYDRRHINSPIVTYAAAQQRKWRHPKSDLGGFSFTLQNTDGHRADARTGRIVAFSDNGLRTWQGLIERLEKRSKTQGEEADQQTTVAGRGIGAIFEECGVYPDGPLSRQPFADTRYFNFASPALDRSSWTAAVVLTRFSGFLGYMTPIIPADWPAASIAEFIWSRDFDYTGGGWNHPVGTSYFEAPLTLGGADDRVVRLFTAVDDNYELWFDGIPVDSYVGVGVEGWLSTHQHDVIVSPGTHVVAIKATNIPRAVPNNFGSVLFDAWTVVEGNDNLDTNLLRSGPGWVCVDYPTEPPGFNFGETLLTLITEGQARGVLNDLGVTFTTLVDSAGTPWPSNIDLSFGTDKHLVDVLLQMSEMAIDWSMSPTGFELNVYVKGALRTASGVALTPGVNITELTHSRAG